MTDSHIAGLLSKPKDGRSEEVEILRNENIYLKKRMFELENKIEEMKKEKVDRDERKGGKKRRLK